MQESRKKVEEIIAYNNAYESAYIEHECETYREKIDLTKKQLTGSLGEVLLKTAAVGIVSLVAVAAKYSILDLNQTMSGVLTSVVNVLPYSAATIATFGINLGKSIVNMLDKKKEYRLANMDYDYNVRKAIRDSREFVEENYGGKSR